MTESEFGPFFDELAWTFGKTNIHAKVKGQACADVKDIPSEALDYIKYGFKNLDSWPSNFAKTVQGLWQKWKEEHPERIANAGATSCDVCADGYLYAVKDGFSYVFRCARCQRSRANAIQWAMPEELERQGYISPWINCGFGGIPYDKMPPRPAQQCRLYGEDGYFDRVGREMRG